MDRTKIRQINLFIGSSIDGKRCEYTGKPQTHSALRFEPLDRLLVRLGLPILVQCLRKDLTIAGRVREKGHRGMEFQMVRACA
jgi:hypothetical protein